MSKSPPERISFSIPSDSELTAEMVNDFVEQSEYSDRSEAIREILLEQIRSESGKN